MATGVIHFDLLGRISALDPNAEALLGLAAEQVVRSERVAMLVPGQVAVEQLPGWLAAARRDGVWEGDGLCRHGDGHPLPCHLRITARFQGGEPVGFTQEVTLLPGVRPESLAPRRDLGAALRRLAAITRLPFVIASLLAVLFGLAFAAISGVAFSWVAGGLVLLCVLSLHLGANTANDWYDWRSGADAMNHDFVAPFSGGSRSLPMGLISERGLALLIAGCFLLGGLAGLALVWRWAPSLLWVGLGGAALGFFYSAPPLRLSARRGLGELAIFLSFGPLLTVAGFAAAGAGLSWQAAAVGVPTGLWTLGILWVNQIPDVAGDRAAGKLNLVALLGRRRAAPGLPLLLGLGHLAMVLLVVLGVLPWSSLLSLAALPLAIRGSRVAWRHAETDAVAGACAATVQHQLVAGALSVLGVAGACWLG